MYWIAAAVTGIFFILLCLGRKEESGRDTAFMLRPFYKMAMFLYKRCCSRFPGLFSAPQVERDLKQLYPGEAAEYLKTGYYVKKGAVTLAVIFAGTLLGAAARYSAESGRILEEDGTIERGSYQDGTKDVSVKAKYGQNRFDFQLRIEPALLDGEAMETLFREFLDRLPGYMAGENESLQSVRYDLVLEEVYGEYPICVEWESDRPDLVSHTGYVAAVEEREDVILLARMTYGKYHRTEEIAVTLLPPAYSQEERLYAEMEEMLQQAQDDSAAQVRWTLPAQWRGENIDWTQSVEDNGYFLWGAAMAAAAAVYLCTDRDLHRQLERKRESMRREYPEIVHKLVLFVGAGMTIRGAFRKIAGDYEEKTQNGGRDSPAYEEMLYTCRELRSGVSEGASYEHFGKRTGLQEYIRLSTLLMQNLKRGNSTLLERLREEADKAFQEQLRQGKKRGEEAGTRLLIPMVLMLAVVMAVIMVPALSNM